MRVSCSSYLSASDPGSVGVPLEGGGGLVSLSLLISSPDPPESRAGSTTEGCVEEEEGVSCSEGSSEAARLGEDVSEKEGSRARFCIANEGTRSCFC